jgi:hypothetical protein
LLSRTWPWDRRPANVTVNSAQLRRDVDFLAAVDASDGGLGFEVPGAHRTELLPISMISRSSFARELFGITRAVECGDFPPGSVILVFCDNQGAVSAASASSSARSAPDVARRLVRALLQRDIVLRVAWLPREQLTLADSRSRPHHSAAFSSPPVDLLQRSFASTWPCCRGPSVEAFASEGDRVASVTFGSLQPSNDPACAGDGLALLASAPAHAHIWANPPAVLASRSLTALLARRDASPSLLLLPLAVLHHRLALSACDAVVLASVPFVDTVAGSRIPAPVPLVIVRIGSSAPPCCTARPPLSLPPPSASSLTLSAAPPARVTRSGCLTECVGDVF